MDRISVDFAGIKMNTPIIAASGTFGYGMEYSQYCDLNKVGGVSVKGTTLEERQGNPGPRVAECKNSILNCVGLQNPGVEKFVEEGIPFLRKFSTAIIANVAGNTVEDYYNIVKRLDCEDVDAFEVNVSCPNVKHGGAQFGVSAQGISEITSAVRKATTKPLIIKLSPNVTDIVEMAKAAEVAGADCLSLINTLLGMKIDIKTRRPILSNNYGGMSGPAVMPVAVRMVNQVYNNVSIPIIGMGGIETAEDVIEFMLAGASAVMVGTANFVNPRVCEEIADDLVKYCVENDISNISELTGKVELWQRD